LKCYNIIAIVTVPQPHALLKYFINNQQHYNIILHTVLDFNNALRIIIAV